MDDPELLAALGGRFGRIGGGDRQGGVNQFAQRPNVTGDAKLHGGAGPQGFMDAAQIVMGDVQADRRRVVFKLL